MKYAFLLLLVSSLASTSCGDATERPLNAETRKIVSQTYADTVRTLTPIVDSLCDVNHDKLVAHLADSIYKVRIADLNRQRKRFQQ